MSQSCGISRYERTGNDGNCIHYVCESVGFYTHLSWKSSCVLYLFFLDICIFLYSYILPRSSFFLPFVSLSFFFSPYPSHRLFLCLSPSPFPFVSSDVFLSLLFSLFPSFSLPLIIMPPLTFVSSSISISVKLPLPFYSLFSFLFPIRLFISSPPSRPPFPPPLQSLSFLLFLFISFSLPSPSN